MTDQKVIFKEWQKTHIFVSLFFATTIFLYTPIESYIGNTSEFWFPLWSIAIPFLTIFIGAFLLCIALYRILPQKGRLFFTLLLFTLSFLAYLQINFLNANYGVLGATQINWDAYKVHFIWDACLWIIVSILIIFIGMRSKKVIIRKGIGLASFILSSMQIITLAILLISTLFTTSDTGKTGKILSTEGMFELGADEGSAIVFILDTMDNQFFQQALVSQPELETVFDGFTYFDNCIGSYTKTAGAVPYIISGQYNKNESSKAEYFKTAYTNSSLLNTLEENNYDIRCYVDSVAGDAELAEHVSNGAEEQIKITNVVSICKEMMKYVLFRQVPDVLKPQFYVDTTSFNVLQEECSETNRYLVNDALFYKQLCSLGIQVADGKTFRMYHLRGSHAPYNLNEEVEVVSNEAATGLSQTTANLKILQEFFDQMKAQGIYDSTNILVLADHSRWLDGDSIFLAKPANSTGELQTSHVPLSHKDVHNTLFDMMQLPDVSYGISAFDTTASRDVRTAYLYDENKLSEYEPWLPPLWEVEYKDESNIPYYTGKIYSKGIEYDLASIATEIELGKTYSYEEMRDLFSFGTLSWGDSKDKYIFTNQECGKIYFKLNSLPESGITMEFNLLKWMPVSPNKLIIKCGNDILFEQEFTGEMPESIAVYIDSKYINAETNTVILEMLCPNVKYSQDHRKMGFGIYSILIKEN